MTAVVGIRHPRIWGGLEIKLAHQPDLGRGFPAGSHPLQVVAVAAVHGNDQVKAVEIRTLELARTPVVFQAVGGRFSAHAGVGPFTYVVGRGAG